MKKLILAAMMLIPAVALANPGPYVGVKIGFDNGIAGSLNAGYLWGDDSLNYGMEVSALGSTILLSDFYRLSLLSVMRYTFTTGFFILGKAGIAYVNQSDTFITTDDTNTAIGPQVALGFGYQFNPHWEINLTGTATFANSHSTNYEDARFYNPIDDSDGLFLGLTYHFA